MIPWLSFHSPTLMLVFTTAVVLTVGAAGQLLSRRLAVPAILFLLGAGIVLGPDGLALVRPEVYGEGLRALIAVAVAVIVFEGALLIDVPHLRHCSRSVLGLVTVGAGTTFVLAGAIAHWLVGMPWKIAFLFGAIVSVTGPTVVTPILKRLSLTRRLKTTLEAEAVLVDALGVLLTSAVFAFVTGSHHTLTGGLMHLLRNLAMGAAIGALGAGVLRGVLGRRMAPPADLVRPIVLAGVLMTYSLAEAAAHESGIAAVAVAGLILGSLELPHKEAIKEFKSDLTYIALSLVFILLAASMRLHQLVALGWAGVGTVALLMGVVRPVAVALATWGTTLSFGERAFIAWLGPRGIVAASMASLMAVELKAWNVQGAEAIAPLVFLTIILTVLVEGSGAGWVARRLEVMPKKILLAGADERARRLAHRLVEDGETVTLVDMDPENVRLARSEGLHALDGDATHGPTLAEAGAGWCQVVVAATPSDRANARITEAVNVRYPALPVMPLADAEEPVEQLRMLLGSET